MFYFVFQFISLHQIILVQFSDKAREERLFKSCLNFISFVGCI